MKVKFVFIFIRNFFICFIKLIFILCLLYWLVKVSILNIYGFLSIDFILFVLGIGRVLVKLFVNVLCLL